MRSLTVKLTLAFLLVSLIGIALVAVLVQVTTAAEFNRFLIDRGASDFATNAATYYQNQGSWAGVETYMRHQITSQGPNIAVGKGQQPASSGPNDGGGRGQHPAPFVLADASGTVVIPFGPYNLGDQLTPAEYTKGTPVTVNQKTVGYVLNTGGPPPDPFGSRYIIRTNQALILASLGAVVIAVLLGLFLARTITRPVRDLTIATSAMAQGHLNQQVPVRSKDELGELTRAFNKMSADLERSNHLRKQMTADIAHDLRTPLSVITGYLEGLKDGVVKPSPKRFTAMYSEALFLQRLVEDLRTLSLADAGELSMNRQPVQPAELMDRLASSFQHQAEQNQIQLTLVTGEHLPVVQIDPERMMQALSNLVSNAVRYTPAGGEITLSAQVEGDRVMMGVRDSGSGIPADNLPHIFERFYRGDDSRQEEGSGLGLAIAKSIVELQGGKISATSDGPGKGSLFSIQIPC